MDILIVDDERSVRQATAFALEGDGHYVETAEDSASALGRLRESSFELIFLDLRLGAEDGLEVLKKVLELKPEQLVVMFTAHASIQTAVRATQLGAFDFLEKPFVPEQLRALIVKASKALRTQGEVRELKQTVSVLKSEAQTSRLPLHFESEEERTRTALDMLFRAAGTPASVLILGESGTGKSVIAREVHERSHLRDKPLVTISCPSLSRELLESELFGHVRGAFTGAVRDKTGKVAAADGGTLFLDEIGELPLEIQAKLLRLLQEREYERVGDNKTMQANVRVIAATNRDLRQAVAEGTFREDLYYRLNVIAVTIPPLRERRRDLKRFASRYLDHFSAQVGRKFDGFEPSAWDAIVQHSWPGNLRELRNAIERAVILSPGCAIAAADLPAPAMVGLAKEPAMAGVQIGSQVRLEDLETAHIRAVLGWAPSLQEAAEILGIDKATLYRKRKRLDLD
ncbi:MAG TPA: sigma-54 dependent transcriptional regulator [Luteolibacter sp.]